MSARNTSGDCPQLTWDLLDGATVLRFSRRSRWSNWPNVRWAARQFWSTQLSAAEDAPERQATWHHLVMTAGNFKRQTPIYLPDLPQGPDSADDADAPLSFTFEVDGRNQTVKRDSPDSWEHLSAITGIGVATATTVLSALWPGWHVIADRRDLGVGIGLAYEEAASEGLLRTAGYEGETVSWPRYRWFRPKVIARAAAIDVEAFEVERAMYEIDVETATSVGTPWSDYRRALCTVLAV